MTGSSEPLSVPQKRVICRRARLASLMVLEDVFVVLFRLISRNCICFLAFFPRTFNYLSFFFLFYSCELGSRHIFCEAASVPITPAFLSVTVFFVRVLESRATPAHALWSHSTCKYSGQLCTWVKTITGLLYMLP